MILLACVWTFATINRCVEHSNSVFNDFNCFEIRSFFNLQKIVKQMSLFDLLAVDLLVEELIGWLSSPQDLVALAAICRTARERCCGSRWRRPAARLLCAMAALRASVSRTAKYTYNRCRKNNDDHNREQERRLALVEAWLRASRGRWLVLLSGDCSGVATCALEALQRTMCDPGAAVLRQGPADGMFYVFGECHNLPWIDVNDELDTLVGSAGASEDEHNCDDNENVYEQFAHFHTCSVCFRQVSGDGDHSVARLVALQNEHAHGHLFGPPPVAKDRELICNFCLGKRPLTLLRLCRDVCFGESGWSRWYCGDPKRLAATDDDDDDDAGDSINSLLTELATHDSVEQMIHNFGECGAAENSDKEAVTQVNSIAQSILSAAKETPSSLRAIELPSHHGMATARISLLVVLEEEISSSEAAFFVDKVSSSSTKRSRIE